MNITTTRPTAAIALPDADDPYAEIAAEGGGQFGKILKYVKGTWSHGDDVIAIGTEFVALIDRAMRGDVRFADSKPVEQRLGFIRDRHQFAARADLGFADQSKWEKDKRSGIPRDLCRQYSPFRNTTRLPIVSLQTDRYNHPDYSWIDIPVLKIEGWDDNMAPPDQDEPPIAPVAEPEIISPTKAAKPADMNDDIPF